MTRSSGGSRPNPPAAFRHITLVEALGFGAIAAVVWIDELFDVPHRLFGAPESPARIMEATTESFGVILLAVFVIVFTRRLTRRVAYLESYISMCAWCRRVRRDGQWYGIEAFFARHDAQTSHGICPDCEQRALGGTPRGAGAPDRGGD
jgi:hypothetical protein